MLVEASGLLQVKGFPEVEGIIALSLTQPRFCHSTVTGMIPHSLHVILLYIYCSLLALTSKHNCALFYELAS